jgi:hypothetical protein
MILLNKNLWEIKTTKQKGRGIFSKKELLKGTVIGDYLGVVIHPKDAVIDEENFYLMYYNDYALISPDLKKPGVHLLNHSCNPNAFLYTYKGHALAFALRKIELNEEMTIPYLLSPKDEYCNPCMHVCKCNDAKCNGTMHLEKETYAKWRLFNDKWAKKTRRQKVTYGKDLPKLLNYPKMIPEDYINQVTQLFKF